MNASSHDQGSGEAHLAIVLGPSPFLYLAVHLKGDGAAPEREGSRGRSRNQLFVDAVNEGHEVHTLNIILSSVVGCAALIAAFTMKQFYRRAPGSHKLGQPLPLWFGRLISAIVGIGFLLSAIQHIRER